MSKVLFVTFDESNKARARKPRSMPISGANMTDKRKGKIAYELLNQIMFLRKELKMKINIKKNWYLG